MDYKEIADVIVRYVGGIDNIACIRNKPGEICIIVFEDSLIKQDYLTELKDLKKFDLNGNKLFLYFNQKDTQAVFNNFKNIPNSSVRVRKRDEIDEDNNDLPLKERMKNLLVSDLIPLIIGLGFSGYLLGVIAYVGAMLS